MFFALLSEKGLKTSGGGSEGNYKRIVEGG